MPWTTTRDLPTFLAAAGGFLRARPVANTVLLSVLASLEAAGRETYGGAAPEYGWWRSAGGEPAGAFLRTPPWPVLLSEMPDEAAADLAGLPDDPDAPATGANGG
ncbi:MAG TPA: GNAT family N-acetyltransferase, partial [Streptomyces sp.]|nr:GNAT family N-acetyltransferase [Streptomyces sp.]